MLYIEEITLHNFKSFKNSKILFTNGFNCIVGPNGSGKSSICDSILFALGESSLKRLRVNTNINLINNSVKTKNKKEVKKAFVTIKFNGTKKIEIQKLIDSNNNTFYRLDGKRILRQDIIEVLKAYKAEINNTNTMMQGEIIQVLNYNPKERRTLIDTAAGIKQFDDKKTIALKELDKVELKINEANVLLNERFGFLKELKTEKDEAEHYIELTKKSKLFNFIKLKNIEQELLKMYEENLNKINLNNNSIKKIQDYLSNFSAHINTLSNQKLELTKKMNQDSTASGMLNRTLNEINKKITVKELELNSFNSEINNINQKLIRSNQELSQIKEKIKANIELIENQKIKIQNIEQKTKDSNNTNKNNNKKFIEEYNRLNIELEKSNNDLSNINQDKIKYEEQIKNIGKNLKEQKQKYETNQKEIKNYELKINELNQEIKKTDKISNEYKDQINQINKKINIFNKDIDNNDIKILNIKEKIAISKSSLGVEIDNILKKEMKEGFYGYAYEFFSNNEKYNIAINACAGNRLNYFIVDSIEYANKAINILKSKRLGIASFIPINDLISKQTKQVQNTDRLIDLIKFDKKFEKVFQYIFFNSYFIKDIKYAKQIGLGIYRYVTSEGEVIEPSGIISGGSFKIKKKIYQLEVELNSLNLQKSKIKQETENLNNNIKSFATIIAKQETENLNKTIELKYLQSNLENSLRLINNINTIDQTNKLEFDKLNKINQELESKQELIKNKVQILKQNIKKIYSGFDKIINNEEISNKNELEEDLVKDLETLKIQYASLTKENEMINIRINQLEKEIIENNENKRAIKTNKIQAESELKTSTQELVDLENKIKTKYKNSESVFNQIKALENKISEIGFEKGKSESNLERINKDNIEFNLNREHMQVRLTDIKSEINSINEDNIIQIINSLEDKNNNNEINKDNIDFILIQKLFKIDTIEQLEIELETTKKELEKMQTVNLKAPEIYLLKQKDLNDMQQKLSTLKTEKNSILEMINEVENRKLNIFNKTFDLINLNLKKLYKVITIEEQINLKLDKPLDPFNSGLFINLTKQNNKKDIKSIDILSGGEKSLLMIVLLLAIQMRNLLSFYLFDEIDAALDKENSKKLSKLIKELSKNSQFIVVSHNDSLIIDADTAIGIAKQNDESKAIGVQINKI